MTSLPSGLASISARMDDAPNVRGAVAFGRMHARLVEVEPTADETRRFAEAFASTERCTLTSAIDPHASLICGSAYKGRDQR